MSKRDDDAGSEFALVAIIFLLALMLMFMIGVTGIVYLIGRAL